MESDWLKIKSCFAAMNTASDLPPASVHTRSALALAAAKHMRPRADSLSLRKLSSRILYICFGE